MSRFIGRLGFRNSGLAGFRISLSRNSSYISKHPLMTRADNGLVVINGLKIPDGVVKGARKYIADIVMSSDGKINYPFAPELEENLGRVVDDLFEADNSFDSKMALLFRDEIREHGCGIVDFVTGEVNFLDDHSGSFNDRGFRVNCDHPRRHNVHSDIICTVGVPGFVIGRLTGNVPFDLIEIVTMNLKGLPVHTDYPDPLYVPEGYIGHSPDQIAIFCFAGTGEMRTYVLNNNAICESLSEKSMEILQQKLFYSPLDGLSYEQNLDIARSKKDVNLFPAVQWDEKYKRWNINVSCDDELKEARVQYLYYNEEDEKIVKDAYQELQDEVRNAAGCGPRLMPDQFLLLANAKIAHGVDNQGEMPNDTKAFRKVAVCALSEDNKNVYYARK